MVVKRCQTGCKHFCHLCVIFYLLVGLTGCLCRTKMQQMMWKREQKLKAPAAFEPSDAEQQQSKGGKKKFGRKKGKKAKSADRDFDDFENPLATDDVQYAET